MNKNQKIAFWTMFIGFCITGSISIYSQGAFEHTYSKVGAGILVVFYLLVGYFINLYVRKNPEK